MVGESPKTIFDVGKFLFLVNCSATRKMLGTTTQNAWKMSILFSCYRFDSYSTNKNPKICNNHQISHWKLQSSFFSFFIWLCHQESENSVFLLVLFSLFGGLLFLLALLFQLSLRLLLSDLASSPTDVVLKKICIRITVGENSRVGYKFL